MRSRCGRRAFRASPIRCVGERIMATGVPEFREVAWRAWNRGLKVYQPQADNLPTYSNGDSRLDWILISSELKFVSYKVLPDKLSDHLMLVAEIQLSREAGSIHQMGVGEKS
ncbi:hypothetical protein [Bathymodiolus japonicus methanotrophic gill symbiont]|uniref:hypothetical protein n=1 Tax=Bathymodiolus japonicus methanotrophic gill symbiont TaxID=113269 RepID=UPI001C8EFEDC|nr:hypothetical protein [Bathymodiolus japonicus methanotrophic gill symbiont]